MWQELGVVGQPHPPPPLVLGSGPTQALSTTCQASLVSVPRQSALKKIVSKWSGREAMGKNVKRASFAISEWNAAT